MQSGQQAPLPRRPLCGRPVGDQDDGAAVDDRLPNRTGQGVEAPGEQHHLLGVTLERAAGELDVTLEGRHVPQRLELEVVLVLGQETQGRTSSPRVWRSFQRSGDRTGMRKNNFRRQFSPNATSLVLPRGIAWSAQ